MEAEIEAESAAPSAMEELERDPSTRKRFLAKLGGTAAAGSFAMFAAACGRADSIYPNKTSPEAENNISLGGGSAFGEGDVGIVNYALFLEHFESDFYDFINNSGLISGKAYELSRQIEQKEREHLLTLREVANQLGAQPTEKPVTRFDFSSEREVLKAAVMIENTGPGAYLGQAPRIRSADILASALAIHTVEARQATALNMLTGRSISPDGAFARPLSIKEVMTRVDPMVASNLGATRQ